MEIEISALLHDIGHGPYSHDSEEVIEKYTRRSHSDVKFLLEKEEIAAILDELGYRSRHHCRPDRGQDPAGPDRLWHAGRGPDGLPRQGRILYGRLLRDGRRRAPAPEHTLLRRHDRPEPPGLKSAEALLMSRFLMYPSVYNHHVGRITGAMFSTRARMQPSRACSSPVRPAGHGRLRGQRNACGTWMAIPAT